MCDTNNCRLHNTFTEASTLVYITSFGYNHLNSACHWKSYSDCEKLCASFIYDAKMNTDLNQHLTDDINYMTLRCA